MSSKKNHLDLDLNSKMIPYSLVTEKFNLIYKIFLNTFLHCFHYIIEGLSPLGYLPMLEVDGKKLCESMAILRYVARECGKCNIIFIEKINLYDK